MLSWRSKYPITSKETLLTYLREHKLLEIDAEVKLCYKDIMSDLEVLPPVTPSLALPQLTLLHPLVRAQQMNREKLVFVIYLGKNKPIYFINEAPHYKPMDEQVMQLWAKTFTEGTSVRTHTLSLVCFERHGAHSRRACS